MQASYVILKEREMREKRERDKLAENLIGSFNDTTVTGLCGWAWGGWVGVVDDGWPGRGRGDAV